MSNRARWRRTNFAEWTPTGGRPTTPGLNFIYVHLNRMIRAQDLSVIYITGPGTEQAESTRVMEILSEHTRQGWLEGYLLTGRHGLFSCYEAFIHIIDSMFNQHAKWLKVASKEVPWRRPIASSGSGPATTRAASRMW
mgnify:CR=1 FL=1